MKLFMMILKLHLMMLLRELEWREYKNYKVVHIGKLKKLIVRVMKYNLNN